MKTFSLIVAALFALNAHSQTQQNPPAGGTGAQTSWRQPIDYSIGTTTSSRLDQMYAAGCQPFKVGALDYNGCPNDAPPPLNDLLTTARGRGFKGSLQELVNECKNFSPQSCTVDTIAHDCPSGTVWSSAGGIPHCVRLDPTCVVGYEVTHDALANPACTPCTPLNVAGSVSCNAFLGATGWNGSVSYVDTTLCGVPQPRVYGGTGSCSAVPVPAPCGPDVVTSTACPAPQTGRIVHTTVFSGASCTGTTTDDASGCSNAAATCTPSSGSNINIGCPASYTGTHIVRTDITCPGSVPVTIDVVDSCTAPASCTPSTGSDVNVGCPSGQTGSHVVRTDITCPGSVPTTVDVLNTCAVAATCTPSSGAPYDAGCAVNEIGQYLVKDVVICPGSFLATIFVSSSCRRPAPPPPPPLPTLECIDGNGAPVGVGTTLDACSVFPNSGPLFQGNIYTCTQFGTAPALFAAWKQIGPNKGPIDYCP
ncbi:MAG: hypothetical protein K2Y28_05955 [Burkholderiaceae bacterium]|nr:hypothetical protein [Burkholderiaceae bacterium]